jgi:hypothetical protein
MRTLKRSTIVAALLLLFVGLYHYFKPMADGLNFEGEVHSISAEKIHFFGDLTYTDANDIRTSEQQIFDELFRMIDDSEYYVFVDMFFYSDFNGAETRAYRNLSSELTARLIEKKTAHPEIVMQVVTDPINVMYGGHVSQDFYALEKAGIDLVVTDLRQLRDSSPIYSAVWRTFIQWFGNSSEGGYLPNPVDVDSPKLGLRSYFELINFKANHRKIVVTDFRTEEGIGLSTLITSANPNDGSGAHSNVAVRVDSLLWRDVLRSEAAVVQLSGGRFVEPPTIQIAPEIVEERRIEIQLLTEGAIEKSMLASIDNLRLDDELNMSMFAIADRDIVNALLRADHRGVKIRLLLDPSKGAFGQEGTGMPNRQVAQELVNRSLGNTEIRWCDTHGEQCHSKLIFIRQSESAAFFLGSANLTKRNLGNYNLESDVLVSGYIDQKVFLDVANFFQIQWENEPGKSYSVPYEEFLDVSRLRSVQYRVQEFTGLTRW